MLDSGSNIGITCTNKQEEVLLQVKIAIYSLPQQQDQTFCRFFHGVEASTGQ